MTWVLRTRVPGGGTCTYGNYLPRHVIITTVGSDLTHPTVGLCAAELLE